MSLTSLYRLRPLTLRSSTENAFPRDFSNSVFEDDSGNPSRSLSRSWLHDFDTQKNKLECMSLAINPGRLTKLSKAIKATSFRFVQKQIARVERYCTDCRMLMNRLKDVQLQLLQRAPKSFVNKRSKLLILHS
jgi:hypothetical protein